MGLRQVIGVAVHELQEVVGKPLSSVSEVTHTPDGWHLLIELIERKSIPDTQDMLGVYEVMVDPSGEITHYERIRTRRRMDLEERLE